MYNLYETIAALCEQRGIKPGRMCNELGISRGAITDLKAGRKQSLSAETLSKIANYFEVTVDYLLGSDEKNDLTPKSKVTDDDIKFALFGGGPVSDVQYEEVKQFVRFIKERDAHGKKE